MNKRRFYPPQLLLFIFPLLIFSCKKTDIKQTENVVERFLKVPANASPQMLRTIEDLRKKNEANPFIETFINRHGYPLWQYAKFTKPKNAPSIYASQLQEELLEVPIVKDMAEYVNGILNVKIDAEILYKVFERNAWETYGFNKAPERTSPSADDVVRKIMEYEKEIWAEDVYKVSDNRLFDYWPADIIKPSSFYLRSNITVDGITVIYLYEECECNNHGEIEDGVEPEDNINYAPETGLCLVTTIIIDDNPWAGGGGDGWIDFPGGSINSSNIGSWDNGGGGGGGAGATGENPCDPDFKWTRLEVRDNNQLFNPCLEEVINLGEAGDSGSPIPCGADGIIADGVCYTAANYPGKEEGYPFMWWLDADWLNENFSFNVDVVSPSQKLTLQEIALIFLYPGQAITVARNSNNAENTTIDIYGSNSQNRKPNAFKHTYWMALNAKYIGPNLALMFGEAHESQTPPARQLEKNMDLHNNTVGVLLYNSGDTEDMLKNEAQAAVINGACRYITNLDGNGNVQSNSQLIPTNQ